MLGVVGDRFMDVARSLAPFHDRFLLTGAGFAKPWNGYLAAEFWDQLIRDRVLADTHPKVYARLHDITAFEDLLAELEVTSRGEYSDDERAGLRDAVRRAFERHDRNLCDNGTDGPGFINGLVERFVADNKTAPIFTVNQDLMLERYYTKGNFPRVVVPGVHRQEWWLGDRVASAPWLNRETTRTAITFTADRYVNEIVRRLSYVKLHGSIDWRLGNQDALVLGGSKEEAIHRFDILSMGFAVFRAAMASGAAHLLVIGYGFGDKHINDVIAQAVETNGLKVSVIDPMPRDDLRKKLEGGGWPQIWRGLRGRYPEPLKEILRQGSAEWRSLGESFFAA